MAEITEKHCKPCEEGTQPLDVNNEEMMLAEVPAWEINRTGEHSIRRMFKFDGFRQAIDFVNKIADVAEEENHHPDICISYNEVPVELFTHKIKGLSENDFIMAAKIDAIAGKREKDA